MENKTAREVRFEVSAAKPGVHPWIWNDGGRHQYLHVYTFPRFGDVDGDGEMEVLYVKGCFEQVCYKLDGRQLWRYFDPSCPGFDPIREDSNCPVMDFDGDGVVELACFRNIGGQTCFCMVNARTGGLIRAVPFEPNPMTVDTRVSVVPARLDGPDKQWNLVVSRDYWRIEVYDCRLNLRFSRAVLSMGHTTAVGDMDGSGRDWMFTGTHLFKPDGELAWARMEVLLGTEETHPDSHFIADIDNDGKQELVVATGAHVLERDGKIRFKRPELVPHAQSVRPMKHAGGVRMAFTSMPNADDKDKFVMWRGRRQKNVQSRTLIMDSDGVVKASLEGVHVPQAGDWDGDGEDELFLLDHGFKHMNVWKQDGSLAGKIDIQETVFASDMVVGPVLPTQWARGEQLVTHAWNEDESRVWCVINENPYARGVVKPDAAGLARYTCY